MKIYRKKSNGGSGGGYEPDNITISLTVDDKLEISQDVMDAINGIGTEVVIADATTITQVMQANTLYVIDADTTCTTLTLSLADKTATVMSVYMATIKCGATPPTFTAISGVTWNGTFALEANKTTEINIVNGNGVFFAY